MKKLEITRVIEVLKSLREQYNKISFNQDDMKALNKIDIKLAEFIDKLNR